MDEPVSLVAVVMDQTLTTVFVRLRNDLEEEVLDSFIIEINQLIEERYASVPKLAHVANAIFTEIKKNHGGYEFISSVNIEDFIDMVKSKAKEASSSQTNL